MSRPVSTPMSASPRNHLRDAENHEEQHRNATRKQWAQILALRTLFGDAVAAVFELSAENAVEHASEAIHALRAEMAAMSERRDEAIVRVRAERAESEVTLARVRLMLRDAVEHESAARRARKNVPAWLEEAREYFAVLEAVSDGEPF